MTVEEEKASPMWPVKDFYWNQTVFQDFSFSIRLFILFRPAIYEGKAIFSVL